MGRGLLEDLIEWLNLLRRAGYPVYYRQDAAGHHYTIYGSDDLFTLIVAVDDESWEQATLGAYARWHVYLRSRVPEEFSS